MILFLGRKPPAPTPSALAPDHGHDLIGREEQLALLGAELARARDGAGRWCAVVAPAGGGKSKLLRTWLAALAPEDARVITVAASPFGQAPRAVVDRLLEATTSGADPGATPEEALAALVAGLHRCARDRPLLVVVEDLHWADTDSLALLRALGDRPLPGCVIVVALRDSFAPTVARLFERASRLELPPLARGERERLVSLLLPGRSWAPARAALLDADQGGNPLYLEHAAGYLHETSVGAPPPRSLHEAVLRRLELVLARVNRRGYYERPSSAELARIERTVGEWLDRLETGDYADRAAIAAYLGTLENIDAALVIAGTIAGIPQRRNRRLAAAVDRFYSASFAERVETINSLAEHDRTQAAHAAARGGERAVAASRLNDAHGYYDLAQRLTQGEQQHRHLLALGDVCLARGLPRQARRAYAEAARTAADHGSRARCERRLARATLAAGQPRTAVALLRGALPRLTGRDRLIASCDLAFVSALIGQPATDLPPLDDPTSTSTAAGPTPVVLRTHLRLALLNKTNDSARLARECVSALLLEHDPITDAAALIDTTVLLRQIQPPRADPTLTEAAIRAARTLGNAAAAR